MRKQSAFQFAFIHLRVLFALTLCFVGVLLAGISWTGIPGYPAGSQAAPNDTDRPPRYMPVPGGKPDDLNRMEVEWNNRVTYPTGRFDPTWVRKAALQDARISRNIPWGVKAPNVKQKNGTAAALTLDSN